MIGSYSWIDNVLLDGMDYFAGIFFYFLEVANGLAIMVALIGILINCIKLWFGAIAIRKMAISSMFNFFLFLAAMSLYNIAVGSIAKTATTWGSNAGAGKWVVQRNLVNLMEQAENDLKVAERISKMPEDQAKNYITQQKNLFKVKQVSLASGQKRNPKQKNSITENIVNDQGVETYLNQVNLYRSTEDNIAIAKRNMLALREVLSPTKYRDKQGNLIETYFLDVLIHDKQNGASSFISPSSFLKVAILTAKFLWHREIDYLTIKMSKATEENNEKWWSLKPNSLAAMQSLTWSDIGSILLTMICFIAVICAGIFAIIQYSMCIFEYVIVSSILIAFVPFVLADEGKAVTKKILPVFWGFSIKLLILTICMWFAMYQFIFLCAGQMGEGNPIDATTFAYILFTILIAFIMTQNAPQIAMTILTGQPQLSMNEFLHAGSSMVGTATLMGRAAQKTAGIAKGTAKAVGKVGGKAINAGATIHGIKQESKAAQATARFGMTKGGYSEEEINKVSKQAGKNVWADHAKNKLKDIAHNLSHSSIKSDARDGLGRNGGTNTQFSSRFNQRNDGTSFAHSRNVDGSNQTFKEYTDSMRAKGESKGVDAVKNYASKNPAPAYSGSNKASYNSAQIESSKPAQLPPSEKK